MIIKRTLKSTLPAFALAATVAAAYAVDDNAVVTLANDGGTISWADFVNAIKDPDNAVKGDISKVPNTTSYPAKRAYNAAVTAKNEADEALTAAQEKQSTAKTAKEQADQAVDDAEGVVSTKTTAYTNAVKASVAAQATVTTDSTAVETAQAGLKTAQDNYIKGFQEALTEAQAKVEPAQEALDAAYAAYVKGFQDQLDEAEEELTTKEASRDHYISNDSTQYAGRVATLTSDLKTYSSNLTTLNSSPYLTKETEQVTAPWLQSMINTAKTFWDQFETETVESNPTKIWYIFASTRSGKTLYVSFTEKAPDYLPTFGTADTVKEWQQITGDEFYNSFVEGAFASYNIFSLQIYMGSEYASKNGNNAIYTVDPFDGSVAKSSYPQKLYTTLNNLAKDYKVSQQTGKYLYPDEAQNILNQIQEVEDQYITDYKALYGWHSTSQSFKIPGGGSKVISWKADDTEVTGAQEELNTVTATLKTLRADIKTLKTETIPTLKQDVQDAQEAVKNENATSEAITKAKKDLDDANDDVTEATTKLENAQKAVEDGTAESDAITAANNAISSADTKLTESRGALASAQEAEQAAKQALETANTELETQKGLQTEAANDLAAADKEVTDATAAVTAAAKTLATATEDAQIEANQYAYNRFYGSISLNDDITAEPTGVAYAGSINGQKNIINIPTGELFTQFSGRITNAAINGTLTSDNEGTLKYVAVWTTDATNPGRYYDEYGVRSNYSDIFALGLAARDYYGINPTTKQLVEKTPNTTVYSVTTMPASGTSTTYFATVGEEGGLVYKGGDVKLDLNTFAVAATSDFADVTGVSNVYYADEAGNNICNDVVITDQKTFYCPVNLKAENVTYTRQFKGVNGSGVVSNGYNAVCLPFELKYNMGDIAAICTYDRDDSKKFWFTRVAESVPANTPVLLIANNTFTMDLSDIFIGKTEKQIILDEGATDDPSKAYGLLQVATAGQIDGESHADRVWGLKNGEFQWVDATSTTNPFPAFRLVLTTETSPAAQGAPGKKMAPGSYTRGIGINDGNGNDITGNVVTGVNDVAADYTSLEVVPGQGTITFNSDADYGDVAIYSIDGRVAAMAKVAAGTTTVNLVKGVYIVLGKKVLVK